METITERIWNANQSWCIERVVRVPSSNGWRTLKAEVRRNPYNFQSAARVHQLNTETGEWTEVLDRHITELPAASVSYVMSEEHHPGRVHGPLQTSCSILLREACDLLGVTTECEFEVQKTLVVSTVHLTAETAKGLDDGVFQTLGHDSVEYGYRVYTHPNDEEWEDNFAEAPEMIPIVAKAHELECSYVLFDRDGEIHDCFAQYEW